MGMRMIELDEVLDALRAFEAEHGRCPTWQEWRDGHRRPSITTMCRAAGSWSNALVLAGLDAPGYEAARKWDDNEEAIRRLREGETLGVIARDQGVTAQALGRRLRRHVRAGAAEAVAFAGRRGRHTGELWAA
jgi:hypothetical protein